MRVLTMSDAELDELEIICDVDLERMLLPLPATSGGVSRWRQICGLSMKLSCP